MEHTIKLPAPTKLLPLICTAILLAACGSEDPVSSVNANPITTTDTAVTDEDSSVTTTDVRLNDTDTDNDTLSVIAGNPAAFSGTVINNNNGTFTYTPNADFNGIDRFNYTLSDNNGGSAIGTVNITVNAINDSPIANNDVAGTDEDTSITTMDVRLNDTDIDGDTLLVLAGSPAASNGMVVNNNNGTFTYTPNTNFNGNDNFSYTLSDSNNGSATGTVAITVAAVNDNPIANTDMATTNEDTGVTTIDVRLNDTDIENNLLTATLLANATNGTVLDNNNGTFTYTPNTDFNGNDSFTYTLDDDNGGSTSGAVNITINPVNDNPIATADSVITDEDVFVTTADVRLNDSDIDGDTLMVAPGDPIASNGTVVNNNNGTFTYTPTTNFNGNDGFSYTLNDGNGGITTGNVNITINSVNDIPVAINDVFTTDENSPITSGDLTANDMDVDGNALTATLLTNANNGNVIDNNDNTFSYTPNANFNGSDSFTYTLDDGSGGNAVGTVHITVNPINPPIIAASAALTFDTKIFRFNWIDVNDATHYKLLENSDGVSGFTQVGTNITQGTQTADYSVALHKRVNASYILQSCNLIGCTNDTTINVTGTLVSAIGYFKASNTGTDDNFGTTVSLSDDGSTLAIGASLEDSNTTGINTTANDLAADSGAVYIFTNNANTWSQQAYIKAHNTDAGDKFGSIVSLSSNGDTLAVGALNEDSNTTGVNSVPNDTSLADDYGAAYIFIRTGTNWSQQAYIKASNPDTGDLFGISVSLSDTGNTLAVGAMMEDSDSTGINSLPNDNAQANDSGATYIFTRAGSNWSQQAYIKAGNTGRQDFFGIANSLNADGNTLVVGAFGESSDATGINGTNNNNAISSGAAYVFIRTGSSWNQQAYIKASNTDAADLFGRSVNLSADGNTLAIGATGEASNATGVNGLEGNNTASSSGAVYVFIRDAGNTWSQQTYLKASNTEGTDAFGTSVSFSADGNMLAIGAIREDSGTTGINSTANELAADSGAVYLFSRSGTNWSQLIYLKARNTDSNDEFGQSVSFSSNGNTLAIGAPFEAGDSTGINGPDNNNANKAGAVYLY
jgi:hypothetical protein